MVSQPLKEFRFTAVRRDQTTTELAQWAMTPAVAREQAKRYARRMGYQLLRPSSTESRQGPLIVENALEELRLDVASKEAL